MKLNCVCTVRTNGNAGYSNEEGENVGSDWFGASPTSSLGKDHNVWKHLILTHSLQEGGGGGEKRKEEEIMSNRMNMKCMSCVQIYDYPSKEPSSLLYVRVSLKQIV